MKTLRLTIALLALIGVSSIASAPRASAETVTFEGLLSSPNTFYRGDFDRRGWTVGDLTFDNTLIDFGGGFVGWDGWSYSNVIDPITAEFENQFASAPGGGSDGLGGVAPGETYALAFGSGAFIDFATAHDRSNRWTRQHHLRSSIDGLGRLRRKPFGGRAVTT